MTAMVPVFVVVRVLRDLGGGVLAEPLVSKLTELGYLGSPRRLTEQDADELDWRESVTDRPGSPMGDDRRDTTPAPPNTLDRLNTIPSPSPAGPPDSER